MSSVQGSYLIYLTERLFVTDLMFILTLKTVILLWYKVPINLLINYSLIFQNLCKYL